MGGQTYGGWTNMGGVGQTWGRGTNMGGGVIKWGQGQGHLAARAYTALPLGASPQRDFAQ